MFHFFIKAIAATAFAFFFLQSALAQTAGKQERVFACNNFPPQKIENPGDGLPGYDVEILTQALNRSGYLAKIDYYSWKRAKRSAENGDVDGLCSCSYRPEREEHFLFTDSIGFVSTGIYTKVNYNGPKITMINDLKGKLVGVVSGYNLEAELINQDIEITGAEKELNAIRMIEANRFDYFYSYQNTVAFILSRQNKQNSMKFHPINTTPYYICINKKADGADDLVLKINTALRRMRADQTIQNIMANYR